MGTPHTDHAHEVCADVHSSGPFADGIPHCGECGLRVPPEVVEAVEALTEVLEAVALVAAIAEAETEARRAVLTLPVARRILAYVQDLPYDEMVEVYGDDLAAMFLDLQSATGALARWFPTPRYHQTKLGGCGTRLDEPA